MKLSGESLTAFPGKTGGRLGVELAEMECFKARAMQIIRKSRDPSRCLELMRIKADSLLDSGGSSERGLCSSPEIPLPLQVGTTTLVLNGAQLAAPEIDITGRCHGNKPLAGSDSKAAEGQVDLGMNDAAVGVGSEGQCLLQLCANADLGIQQFMFCNTKELDWICACMFSDTNISSYRFVHGVPVEEEPDPGGFWLSVKHTVKVQFQSLLTSTWKKIQRNTKWGFWKSSNNINTCFFVRCGQDTDNRIMARILIKVTRVNNVTEFSLSQGCSGVGIQSIVVIDGTAGSAASLEDDRRNQ